MASVSNADDPPLIEAPRSRPQNQRHSSFSQIAKKLLGIKRVEERQLQPKQQKPAPTSKAKNLAVLSALSALQATQNNECVESSLGPFRCAVCERPIEVFILYSPEKLSFKSKDKMRFEQARTIDLHQGLITSRKVIVVPLEIEKAIAEAKQLVAMANWPLGDEIEDSEGDKGRLVFEKPRTAYACARCGTLLCLNIYVAKYEQGEEYKVLMKMKFALQDGVMREMGYVLPRRIPADQREVDDL